MAEAFGLGERNPRTSTRSRSIGSGASRQSEPFSMWAGMVMVSVMGVPGHEKNTTAGLPAAFIRPSLIPSNRRPSEKMGDAKTASFSVRRSRLSAVFSESPDVFRDVAKKSVFAKDSLSSGLGPFHEISGVGLSQRARQLTDQALDLRVAGRGKGGDSFGEFGGTHGFILTARCYIGACGPQGGMLSPRQ